MGRAALARAQKSVREAVLSALEDNRFQWRTVDAVVRQTGALKSEIVKILEDPDSGVVRSSVPDEHGRALYTTWKHYRESHGLVTRIINAIADKVA